MRYKELLKENNELDIDQAIAYIKANCSDAINAFKKVQYVLARGFPSNQRSPTGIIQGYPRPDRRPLDSTLEAQILVDDLLSAAGFKALRSNSLFCAPRYYISVAPSNYIVFPNNGFKFTCSLDLNDMAYDFPLVDDNRIEYKETIRTLNFIIPEDFIEKYGFINNDFGKALTSGNEIYILGNYTAIKADKLGDPLVLLNKIYN